MGCGSSTMMSTPTPAPAGGSETLPSVEAPAGRSSPGHHVPVPEAASPAPLQEAASTLLPVAAQPAAAVDPSSVSHLSPCASLMVTPAATNAAAQLGAHQLPTLSRRGSVAECAVSLRFLRQFSVLHALEGWTSAQVKDLVVMPATAGLRCRYVEDPSLVQPADVGRPTYFISHTWTGNFREMVDAISRHLADEIEEEVFVWVDMFAVNQHDFAEDLGNLKAAIRMATGGTLVILGDEGTPLSRVWCLYEFANTVLLKGSDSLQMLSRSCLADGLSSIVANIDIEAAQYSKEEDKDRILGDILLDFGAFAPFNALLKLLLLLEPLDYSVDLASLLEQGGGDLGNTGSVPGGYGSSPIWDLHPFALWLHKASMARADVPDADALIGPQAGDGRSSGSGACTPGAVLVAGGAGEGKSTLSALLVAAAGALRRYQANSERASNLASTIAGKDSSFPVHAWHFFKHNDIRRQDAARVIKTLAYQLGTCPELPQMQAVYMNRVQNGSLSLHPSMDADALFHSLLRAPLEEYARLPGVRTPIVFLFDALDEADSTSGLSSFRHTPMMRVLCELCPTLPGVYFVMTSRDGVEHSHTMSRMRTTFNLQEMQTAQLHKPAELITHVASRLMAPLGGTALVARWRPSTSAEAKEVAAAILDLSRVPYDTRPSQPAQGTVPPPDSAAADGPQLTVGSSAQSTALAVMPAPASAAASHNMVYVTVCMQLLSRGLVVPTKLPATLFEAYALAFAMGADLLGSDGDVPAGEDGKTTSVGVLLSVLVAAREPLSPSQLRSLRLDHLRARLPLRGALFFERDMRMYLLHKSLSDFLTSTGTESGVHCAQVDKRAGHLYLAQASRVHQKQQHQQHMNNTLTTAEDSLCGASAPQLPQPYGLRHMVAHTCSASDASLLETILLDVDLWEATYAAGFGPAAVTDLVHLSHLAPVESSALLADIRRWLRSSNAYMVKFPRAARQLACDAPHHSHIAKHATGLPTQPTARLMNKEDKWPAILATLQKHTGTVAGIAVSPNSQTLVSGSYDNTVMLWDLASGQHSSTLKGHTDGVTCVAFTPDGNSIVSGSFDKSVRVWDLTSGQCLQILADDIGEVTSVACCADGRTLVAGSNDKTARVWDMTSTLCIHVLKGHVAEVTCVAVTLNTTYVVTGSNDHTLRVWDLKSGCFQHALEGHNSPVTSAAVTADGKHIVSGAYDATVRLWDLSTGANMRTLQGHTQMVTCVAVSACGNTIWSGANDLTIRVWDSESGACKATHAGHTSFIMSLALSPNGEVFLSGAHDKTIRMWDVASGSLPSSIDGHSARVTGVAVTDDGQTIVSGALDNTVRIWDLTAGQCIKTCLGHTGPVNTVAVTPDGLHIVSSSDDATLRVWDLSSGVCTTTFEGHTNRVLCAAITSDGCTVVSGSHDMTVRVWDFACGQCKFTLTGHISEVTSVAISPDDQLIVSGAYDIWGAVVEQRQDVRTWSTAAGTCAEVLTGDLAFEKLQSTKLWKKRPAPKGDAVSPVAMDVLPEAKDQISVPPGGDVVDIVTPSGVQTRIAYILPPYTLSHDLGVRINSDRTRLAFFSSMTGRFLFYALS